MKLKFKQTFSFFSHSISINMLFLFRFSTLVNFLSHLKHPKIVNNNNNLVPCVCVCVQFTVLFFLWFFFAFFVICNRLIFGSLQLVNFLFWFYGRFSSFRFIVCSLVCCFCLLLAPFVTWILTLCLCLFLSGRFE